MLQLFVILLVASFSEVVSVWLKAGSIGSSNEFSQNDFDHQVELEINNYSGSNVATLKSVNFWYNLTLGLYAFSANYEVCERSMSASIVNLRNAVTVQEDKATMELGNDELIRSLSGYQITRNQQTMIAYLEFEILRKNGSISLFKVGSQNNFQLYSILGPVVGFYGNYDSQFEELGVYVDLSLWDERPNRILLTKQYGGAGDRAFHDLEGTDVEASNISLTFLTVYYSSSAIRGLLTYNAIPGLTRFSNVHGAVLLASTTQSFNLGEDQFISQVTVYRSDGNLECISGLELLVVNSSSTVVYSVGLTTGESAAFTGKVVGFHGYENDNCIISLGAYIEVTDKETEDLQSGCTPGPYQDIGVVVGLVIGCTVSIIIFSLVPLIACFIYFKQKNEVIPTNL